MIGLLLGFNTYNFLPSRASPRGGTKGHVRRAHTPSSPSSPAKRSTGPSPSPLNRGTAVNSSGGTPSRESRRRRSHARKETRKTEKSSRRSEPPPEADSEDQASLVSSSPETKIPQGPSSRSASSKMRLTSFFTSSPRRRTRVASSGRPISSTKSKRLRRVSTGGAEAGAENIVSYAPYTGPLFPDPYRGFTAPWYVVQQAPGATAYAVHPSIQPGAALAYAAAAAAAAAAPQQPQPVSHPSAQTATPATPPIVQQPAAEPTAIPAATATASPVFASSGNQAAARPSPTVSKKGGQQDHQPARPGESGKLGFETPPPKVRNKRSGDSHGTSETRSDGLGSKHSLDSQHYCTGCGKIRSSKYHRLHPHRLGQKSVANFCRRCRVDHSTSPTGSTVTETTAATLYDGKVRPPHPDRHMAWWHM